MPKSNELKSQRLERSSPVVWICDWNGGTKGLGSIKNSNLSNAVIRQLGKPTYDLFTSDFINYKEGVILCMNQGGVLNKFFATASQSSGQSSGNVGVGIYRGIADSLVFKCVRMPFEFKNQKTNLSTPYSYGEKLLLTVSFENIDTLNGNKTPQLPDKAISYPTKLPGGNKLVAIYRDSNIRGRSIKGGGGTTGAAIGVWS